jgi:hypothetical protein
MANFVDLSALNKSSAKVATFAVKLAGARVNQYTYVSKKDAKTVTANKFEVWMVGSKPESYCIGYVKGSPAVVSQALAKYADGSVWALSKTVLDTYTTATYISTPVLFRVDLSKSTMTAKDSDAPADKQLRDAMPSYPVPPRSVADVSRITTNRSTDLIAVVKQWSKDLQSKSGEAIVDVELIDNSEHTPGMLATMKVSVFGQGKVDMIKASVGEPMVFFNLSVSCSGSQTTITHYAGEVAKVAPECHKSIALRTKKAELTAATNVESLTTEWTAHQQRDVSGPQPLSCAAFLDYTTEMPHANVPTVVQLMWVHLEEPEPESEVLDSTGGRVWFRVHARDASGSVLVGVPQRNAFLLASCETKEDFTQKHAAADLNMPLLCHARISRTVRDSAASTSSQGDASQLATYVNHSLEAVETVNWDPASAPNNAYNDVVGILNNCPPHDEGVMFAFLADIEPDPYYGLRLNYDGQVGPKCAYVAVLIASESKSTTDKVGEGGFKVTTKNIRDIANPDASGDQTGNTTVGYCTLDNLPGFRLDPPRGKTMRSAICLVTKKDDEGLHIHKLEYIEPDQVDNAIACMQKLRKLCKGIHPESKEKRSHAVTLAADGKSPASTKKARTLHTMPTEASLDDDAA